MRISPFRFLIFLLIFAACSTDFQLTTGGETQPVVYGLMDETDSEHYIRIEKTFIDEDIPPAELAQEEEEVFFESLEVELVKNNDSSFILERVNGGTLGLARDSGVFLTDPNYLYTISDSEVMLSAGDSVVLRLRRGAGDTILATAGTRIIGESRISFPSLMNPLTILPTSEASFRWPDNEYAAFFDVIMRFHIDEMEGGNTEEVQLDWPIEIGLRNNRLNLAGERLYNFLGSNLEADPNIQRRLQGIDILLRAGGVALGEFLRVENLATGITSSQVQPNFSNVEGGYGLLSSVRETVTEGYDISPRMRDSLQYNSNVEALNFR